jgi:N,N'-diacetyllegionaminate synthase
MREATIAIGRRSIGGGNPCYVIAEVGVNHNGDRDLARKLVDAACDAGADAVKFQTFAAERLAARSAAKAEYQIRSTGDESQLDMLRKLELSIADHRFLFRHARKRGIEFLSTPFDTQSADGLADLGVRAFKIGSGDLTDRFLLSRVARVGRPVVLSTGGSTMSDIRAALLVMRQAGNPPIALLHCVSKYPAAAEETNLLAIRRLKTAFKCPVGFSDHTVDALAPLLAVALGASILEKHLTLSRAMDGPDHAASLEPGDFALMVKEIRRAEKALGDGRKVPLPGEQSIMAVARKSLYASRSIDKGRVIRQDDLIALRPAGGISPMHADRILGRVARHAIGAGDLLRVEMTRGRRRS